MEKERCIHFPCFTFVFSILILVFLLTHPVKPDILTDLVERIFLTQDPDHGASAPQLITSRGFKYEIHYFVSQDGFINAIHRIVNPKFPVTRSAILLFHGITGASSNFLCDDLTGHIDEPLTFVGSNIGFELAKRGHDVWLIDQRATPFSSNHTRYKSYQKEYWNWSLDEIALLDLPAAIDYIRGCTKRHQIGYIGHSQGSQVMFMLLSRIPKYNNLIQPAVFLAPTFYLGHTVFMTSALLRFLPYQQIELLLKKLGGKLTNAVITDILTEVCRVNPYNELCKLFGFIHLSFGSFLIIPTLPNLKYHKMPVFLSSALYQTVSARQLAHNIQIVRTDEPRMIDYSPEVNMKLYGTTTPPLYDPSIITCKTMAFFSAVSDSMTDPIGVQKLRQRLPVPLIYDHVIKDPSFGHASFIFAERSLIVAYIIRPVISIFDAFY